MMNAADECKNVRKCFEPKSDSQKKRANAYITIECKVRLATKTERSPHNEPKNKTGKAIKVESMNLPL